MGYSLGVGTSSSGPETLTVSCLPPDRGDTEVNLYRMLACTGNGKVIINVC